MAANGGSTNYMGNQFAVGSSTDITQAAVSPNPGASETDSIRYNSAAGNAILTLVDPVTIIDTGGILRGFGASGTLSIQGPAGTSLTSKSGEFMFVANGSSINIGVVATPTGAVLADGSVSTALTFAGNNNLIINSIPTYTGPTTILSTGTLQFNFVGGTSASPLAYSTSGFTVVGILQFNAASGYQVVNGVISGTGAVTYGTSGTPSVLTTVLAAAGAYTGATTINAGTVQLGINNGLSTVTALTMSSGTLNLNGFNQQLGSLTGTVATGLPSGGTIQAGSGASLLTVGSLNTNTTFYGSLIDGGGSLSLAKVGTGTLILLGPNSYSGSTTVSGGVLEIASQSNIGTGNLTVTNLNTGAGTSVVLALNVDPTVGSLNAGIANGGTLATPSSGINTAQLSIGPNVVLTINQTVAGNFGGNITGDLGSLVLGSASTSTLTLSNANYYGGSTTINGGTLIAANSLGSATGFGNVIVNNGGSLAGTGTLSPASGNLVTVNGGGTIRGGDPTVPANNSGTLSISNNTTLISTGNTASTTATLQTQVARTAINTVGSNSLIDG